MCYMELARGRCAPFSNPPAAPGPVVPAGAAPPPEPRPVRPDGLQPEEPPVVLPAKLVGRPVAAVAHASVARSAVVSSRGGVAVPLADTLMPLAGGIAAPRRSSLGSDDRA